MRTAPFLLAAALAAASPSVVAIEDLPTVTAARRAARARWLAAAP